MTIQDVFNANFFSPNLPRPDNRLYSINFSLSTLDILVIDQNTNFHDQQSMTMRKKQFLAFFFSWNFEKPCFKTMKRTSILSIFYTELIPPLIIDILPGKETVQIVKIARS